MLNQENMNVPELNILNFDCGENETMDPHVRDTDVSDWLDELIEELNEQSTLENNVDFHFDFADFVDDMIPQDWENFWNDALDKFDANLLA